MKRDRILTTHAGSLPRTEELKALVFARAEGRPFDNEALAARLKDEVAGIVRKQLACGVDSVNDGELGKTNFNNYVRERLARAPSRSPLPGGTRRSSPSTSRRAAAASAPSPGRARAGRRCSASRR
jgi:hypothetical protein